MCNLLDTETAGHLQIYLKQGPNPNMIISARQHTRPQKQTMSQAENGSDLSDM